MVEHGTVYACGSGGDGQLGLNSRARGRRRGDGAWSMHAARTRTERLRELHGAIWACGRGDEGQLGHGDSQDRLRPTRLGPEAFGGLPVVLVACLGSHDGVDERGWRLDVRQQRGRPARPRRQDRQAPVYAGGPGALWPIDISPDVCLRVRSEPSVATTDP